MAYAVSFEPVPAMTGDPALHLFAGELDDRAMLRICHRRRLSCRARDDDGVRTAGNLILDHAGKLIEIDAVLRERRNESDSCAWKISFFTNSPPYQLRAIYNGAIPHDGASM
jgi:hypothetical protein